MDVKRKLELIKRNTDEILNEKEIPNMLKKKSLKAYCGYEPSGPIHLGHLVTMMKLLDLQKAGIKPIVLLANWHAWLNKKGSWEFIEKEVKTWQKGMKSTGLTKAKFVKGTSFQREKSYIDDVMVLALNTTINRGMRSMQTVARDIDNAKISQIIYPLMQVQDIKALELDFVVGGMDQRKIHALATEQLPKINNKKKPIFLHTGIITSLKGPGSKMSSSVPGSMITINDSKKEIETKIKKAYCPESIVEKNPVLEITKLILFPKFEKIKINRDKKFGGNKTYTTYKDLEKDYQDKKLHPVDLKNTVANLLKKLITLMKI